MTPFSTTRIQTTAALALGCIWLLSGCGAPEEEGVDLCELTAEVFALCEPGETLGEEELADCETETADLSEECYELGVALMQCEKDQEACGEEVLTLCGDEFSQFIETCAN